MIRLKLFAIALFVLNLLSGCAIAPIPFDNLTYREKSVVRSNLSATVEIEGTGIGGSLSSYLMPVGGAFIAMPNRSDRSVFVPSDQAQFLKSLQKELVRLGIFRSADVPPAIESDVKVKVVIDRAFLKGDVVEYILDMTMFLSGKTATSFRRSYRVVSTEKDSLWEKLNTNGAEAKVKLAHLMLERLIPDIESFVLTQSNQTQ